MLGVAAGMTNRYGRTRALGPPLPVPLRAWAWREAAFTSPRPRGLRLARGPDTLPPKPEAGEAFVVLLSCPVRPRGVRTDAVPELGS